MTLPHFLSKSSTGSTFKGGSFVKACANVGHRDGHESDNDDEEEEDGGGGNDDDDDDEYGDDG